MRLTRYGKIVRKRLVDIDKKQSEMAASLGVTNQYVSAVLNGDKWITDSFHAAVCKYFAHIGTTVELNKVKDMSQPQVTIDMKGMSDKDRELVIWFTKRVLSKSTDGIHELLGELDGEEGKESSR